MVTTTKILQAASGWAWPRPIRFLFCAVGAFLFCPAQLVAAENRTNVVFILEIEGKAELLPADEALWKEASANQILRNGDRFRTKVNSRAILRLSDLSQLRVGELSEFQVRFDPEPDAPPIYKLWKGVLYLFHRDKPGRFRIDSPTASAAVRGTEFTLAVEENGRTVLTMLEGEVVLSSDEGQVDVATGQQAVAERGKAPLATAVIQARLTDVVQWCLYYPAVIHLDELTLSDTEQAALRGSLNAYRSGDLLAAVENYPGDRAAASEAERVYHAGLLLAVGKVDQAEALINSLTKNGQPARGARSALALGNSLLRLIATVKYQAVETNAAPALASEWLVESYVSQARLPLRDAREAAHKSVVLGTNFAFGWVRLAELEFGFGNTREALQALDQALALAPRHAQALALKGFLLAAQNRVTEAMGWFDRAIAVDGALGNAWLGRGLCLIHTGKTKPGLQDLQTAAVLEPQRSFLRSYLGKGYDQAGAELLADRELDLAKRLDPRDPTPWLYSALLDRERNHLNRAVDDLERSVALNDHRQVYRSRFLLDEDRAVRSSSLANIYQSAGLTEVSVREATRAVTYDYANYSAHQFLAESYEALRDPTRFNLRYETPWFSEWLLANLLSPVGGTPLAQHISQQEYTRLFEKNRLGLASQTEYRSDGQVREVASQFGNYRNSSYALDLDYQHNDGVRPNNQLDRLELYGTFKQQLTEQDSLLFLTKYQDYHSGDNFQYYDPSNARTNFHYNEYQSPGALVAGYHREWAPGVHTMLLGGRLANDQRLGDLNATNYLAIRDFTNNIAFLSGAGFDVQYRSEFVTYSGELNQIFQTDHHTLVLGARYQSGNFTTRNQILLAASSAGLAGLFPNPPANDTVITEFERVCGYAYWTWEVVPQLRVTPGLTYDTLRFPKNFRHPPVAPGEEQRDQFGPKAAVVWSPHRELTLRGAYARSLGGVSYDESYRLEPTQLAGFSQAYRTLIPESLVGSVAAPEFETAGLGLDLRFKTRTYVTLSGEWLTSKVRQTIGDFESPLILSFTPSSLSENLNYRERSVSLLLNQLVSEEWSLGAGYRFTRSELDRRLPEVPLSVSTAAAQHDQGDLHQVTLYGRFNHPSGWFAGADLNWFIQNSSVRTYPGGLAMTTPIPGDDLPVLNLLAGYRFKRQRGEIAIGALNLVGRDYRFNPINLHEEFARERVFYARLRLRF